jgi:amino acid transporter
LLVWSVLIGVLFAIHAVWTHDTLQDGSFGFAIGLILACAAVAIARDRDTIRRGAPEVEAVPVASLGALITAVAVVACGFGFVFGSFLVFIAVGLFVAGMFVLGRELAGERRARRTWSTRERGR